MESEDAWKSLSDEELDRLMSPSLWNPNKNPDEVVPQHISFCTAETEKAKSKLQYEANVSYRTGVGARQKYDVYGTDLPEEAPIFFWIHGGYWQAGSKDFSAQMAVNLHETGVKTLVLGYNLAPEVTVAQIKSEMFAALKHAMKRFRKANFFIGGHSAGGHLTAALLHEKELDKELIQMNIKNRVLGLLFFAGVFDLRYLVRTSINQPLKLTVEEAESLSPLRLPINFGNVDGNIKLLILVGKLDSPEFQRQSRAYSIKLNESFQNTCLWVSPDDDHFSIVERLCETDSSSVGGVMRNFIQTNLK